MAKKLMLVILFGIIILNCITLVSAGDLTSLDNYKEVSEDLKTIKYYDTGQIGDDTLLAEFKLETEHEQQVGLGYQKKFEYTITNTYDDIQKMIGETKCYDVNDKMKPVDCKIDLKYKKITNYNGINRECVLDKDNKTEICDDVPYDYDIVEYLDYTPKTILKDETVTISGWGNVEQGEKIEWVTTFYDDMFEATEWATWEGNLSNGLVAYYTIDETSGTDIVDSIGTDDAIATSQYLINGTQTAKLGANCGNGSINSVSKFKIETQTLDVNTSQAFSYGGWFYKIAQNQVAWGQGSFGSSANTVVSIDTFGSAFRCKFQNDTNEYTIDAGTLNNNEWYFIVCTFDGQAGGWNSAMWVNGVNVGNKTCVNLHERTVATTNWVIFSQDNDGSSTQHFTGKVDEVFLYNRTLNGDDVNYLYNSGDGCQYGDETCSGSPPTISLNTPEEYANLTNSNAEFSCTGISSTDDPFANVSLIINGTYNNTNTSVSNNTAVVNTIPLADGYYNWTCEVCDTYGCVNATERNFWVNSSTTQVTLNEPEDELNSSSNQITFNVTGTSSTDGTLASVSLYINGTLNITNSSVANASDVINTLTFADGYWNWTGEVCDSNGCAVKTREFLVDTTPPTVNLIYPENTTYNATTAPTELNYTASDDNPGLCWKKLNPADLVVGVPFGQNWTGLSADEGQNHWYIFCNDSVGNENNDSVYFFQDTITPTATINTPPTPANETELTTSYFEIEAYQDGGASGEYVNFTFYVYNSTGIQFNETHNATCYGSGIINCPDVNVNVTGLADGDYQFNITANDLYGNADTTELRYVTIDATLPSIVINYGNGTFDYAKTYSNHTINYTVTDTNLETCWINHLLENVTIDCLTGILNTTQVNITTGGSAGTSARIWANDTFGNINSVFVNWSYIIFQNSVTYNENTYETSEETFYLNISLSSGWSSISAKLNYNNTNYTSDITIGTYDIISNTITIPSINEEENKTFFWYLLLTNSTGTFTYVTESVNQTINNISIHECDGTYTEVSLNFTTKDEVTFVIMNASLEATFDYWYGDGSVVNTYSFANDSENYSNFLVCIYPNITMYINATVSYYAEDYDRREYFFENATINNETQDISLYLMLTNETDIFTFYLIDENQVPITGAYIRVQRWDIGTDNFYTVGMVHTSEEGTGIINSRLNDAWYRYQVIYQGELVKTTEPVKESTTSRIITVNLQDPNPYLQFGNIGYSLTFDNETNVTLLTYADTSGVTQIGCLRILSVRGNSTSIYAQSCVESTSGSIGYNLNESGVYIAQALFILTPDYEDAQDILEELVITVGKATKFVTIGSFGRVISLVLIGTAGMIGVALGSIPMGLMLIGGVIVIVNILGWLYISESVIYSLISILILIALTIKRRT